MDDVVVIGAGVFGTWAARGLQRAGWQVRLVDQYGPASARASSGGETRVIRAAYGPDEIYTRLAQRALPLWRAAFAELAQPDLFRPTGVLWLAGAGESAAAQSRAVLARCGIAHEVLDAAMLAARWPQLRMPADGWGLLEPEGGALLARRAVQALAAAVQRDGAALQCARVRPPQGDGRLHALHTADGARLPARHFVFACGPWLGQALPELLHGRIFPTRQEVFYFGPPAGDVRFAPPALPVWLDSGRDWYGLPDLDGRGFKLAHDAHGAPVDPDREERLASAPRLAEARAFLARRFPALQDAPLLGVEVCQYENTASGDLLIDRHPGFDNVWIVGGGSGHGFKHGPAVAEHLLQRMLHGAPAEPRFALAGKGREQRRAVH